MMGMCVGITYSLPSQAYRNVINSGRNAENIGCGRYERGAGLTSHCYAIRILHCKILIDSEHLADANISFYDRASC